MPLAFPRALHGSESAVKQRILAAAKAWATDLRKGAPLRPLDTLAIAKGTPVYCSEVSLLAPGRAAWRLYALILVRAEVRSELPAKTRDEARGAVEAALLDNPAGVVWLNLAQPEPNTLAILDARVRALVAAWADLSELGFIDQRPEPQPLATVIEDRYRAFLSIWLDDPDTGPITDRLRTAIDRGQQASGTESRTRLVTAIRSLAKRWQRIATPERFEDTAWVEGQLARLKPAAFESAKTGADLSAVVYDMHRRGEHEREPEP
jgi:hypothetical protein